MAATLLQAGLAAALFAAAANAQPYIAAYVGGATTRSSDVTLDQPAAGTRVTFQDVRFSGRSFRSPLYYGYRAGYSFTRRFAVEAEVIHLKVYADLDRPVGVHGVVGGTAVHETAPMRRFARQFEVSHGLNLVLVNAVARRSAGRRLTFVARAGLGPTVPRPEVIVFGRAGGGYQAGPVAVQGAAGVEARLAGGVRIISEYKYTYTPTSFDIPGGRAHFHAHSHHVVVGLGYWF